MSVCIFIEVHKIRKFNHLCFTMSGPSPLLTFITLPTTQQESRSGSNTRWKLNVTELGKFILGVTLLACSGSDMISLCSS
jgi:hypothetical protein